MATGGEVAEVVACVEVRYKTKFGEPVDTYFELNKSGDDKTEVARRKIIQYYFDNGNSNIQDIVDRNSMNCLMHSRGQAEMKLVCH